MTIQDLDEKILKNDDTKLVKVTTRQKLKIKKEYLSWIQKLWNNFMKWI